MGDLPHQPCRRQGAPPPPAPPPSVLPPAPADVAAPIARHTPFSRGVFEARQELTPEFYQSGGDFLVNSRRARGPRRASGRGARRVIRRAVLAALHRQSLQFQDLLHFSYFSAAGRGTCMSLSGGAGRTGGSTSGRGTTGRGWGTWRCRRGRRARRTSRRSCGGRSRATLCRRGSTSGSTWCSATSSRSRLRCRGVLCCALLCFAVLCCALLCFAVLCCALLCFAVLCCALLCFAVLWRERSGVVWTGLVPLEPRSDAGRRARRPRWRSTCSTR
jgi:hypothetical protein